MNIENLLKRIQARMRSKRGTAHIQLDSRRCTGCKRCENVCRREVLKVGGPFFHRHVHVANPTACTGCGRCVATCPKQALQRRGRG